MNEEKTILPAFSMTEGEDLELSEEALRELSNNRGDDEDEKGGSE